MTIEAHVKAIDVSRTGAIRGASSAAIGDSCFQRLRMARGKKVENRIRHSSAFNLPALGRPRLCGGLMSQAGTMILRRTR